MLKLDIHTQKQEEENKSKTQKNQRQNKKQNDCSQLLFLHTKEAGNSEWILDLQIEVKPTNLEENMVENLHDLNRCQLRFGDKVGCM